MDAHVHIHGCYDLALFLDGARRNFRAAARETGLSQSRDAVLLLTETSNADAFSRLAAIAGGATGGAPNRTIRDWRIESTAEPTALLARGAENARILIIAGRQIVTDEGLEVLALVTGRRFADGQSTHATLAEVKGSGAIPVLPWGFGKWLGRRGRLLSRLLDEAEDLEFLLGDTSHRLRILPPPIEFRVAAMRGIRILPGTDPLPFVSQVGRAGSYGFRIAGTLSPDTPATDLKRLLKSRDVHPYGRGENLLRFGLNQTAMQIKKRAPSRTADSSVGGI